MGTERAELNPNISHLLAFLKGDHGSYKLSGLLPNHPLYNPLEAGPADVLAVFENGHSFFLYADGRFVPLRDQLPWSAEFRESLAQMRRRERRPRPY